MLSKPLLSLLKKFNLPKIDEKINLSNHLFCSYPEYLDVALAQTVSGGTSIYNFCLLHIFIQN